MSMCQVNANGRTAGYRSCEVWDPVVGYWSDGSTTRCCPPHRKKQREIRNPRRAIWLAEYDRKRSEKIRLRTGTTTRDAEWRIREIEEQLKWNAEHIHTETTA
jgi:hypothetical protein